MAYRKTLPLFQQVAGPTSYLSNNPILLHPHCADTSHSNLRAYAFLGPIWTLPWRGSMSQAYVSFGRQEGQWGLRYPPASSSLYFLWNLSFSFILPEKTASHLVARKNSTWLTIASKFFYTWTKSFEAQELSLPPVLLSFFIPPTVFIVQSIFISCSLKNKTKTNCLFIDFPPLEYKSLWRQRLFSALRTVSCT